ncbi:acid phosphatase [Lophium mytilinum]|uniref:Acid phosphatase n=1 Tax=Lophium mytilinum TaxID=390894 RepID=A0A6A6QLD2_9PEZI|nr:acid phosphatase [Lophium mytilinum]
MRLLVCAFLPLAALAARIVQSNDDGWAEINIRTLYNVLTNAGNDVILSAPAENQSGRGSLDSPPTNRTSPCEFNSCQAGGATGFNATNPRLNWVNSFPVTSIKHGIDSVAPQFFGTSRPDIAVTGPNVGSNLGLINSFSGTVGAASYAAGTASIPAIAFSGKSGEQTAFDQPTPLYASVYADLALNLTSAVVASGAPLLPAGVFLNVNFPEVSVNTCSSASDFKFVFSRIHTNILPVSVDPDVDTCGNGKRLPTESKVVGTAGCYVSVSPGKSSDKSTVDAATQAFVLDKLKGILSCLPA